MSVVAGWVALIAGLLVWWLAVRRLTTRPWEAAALADEGSLDGPHRSAQIRTGLWVFLAVITSFFGLFLTAYVIRMSPHAAGAIVLQDWRALDEPGILWLNTLLLALGSVGMQIARSTADRGLEALNRAGILAGGAFAIAFLVGQWIAWQQLRAAGFYAADNPANAFFYVLTGLHGLHLLGGLVVWARAVLKLFRDQAAPGAVQLTMELCSVYWHYLLVVWLVMFGLLLIT